MSLTDNLIICRGDLAKKWLPIQGSALPTITATQTGTNYNVYSLVNQYPSDYWRSTDKTANYITFNGNTSRMVAIVMLLYHNITTGTLQLQYSDNDFTDKTDVNMTLVTIPSKRYNLDGSVESYNIYNSYAILSPAVSKRDFRIYINASGISDEYYQAAEVCLFSTYYPVPENYNIDYEWQTVSEKIIHAGPRTQGPARVTKEYNRGVFPFRKVAKVQFDVFDRIDMEGGIVVFPQGLTGYGCYYGQGSNENIIHGGLLSHDNKSYDFVFEEHI